jgi:hypothetical protein
MKRREVNRIKRGGMLRREDRNYDRQLIGLSAPGIRGDLPLVHVTSAGWGREIVRQTKLKTFPCKVFGDNLLYFFILRPAYCLEEGDSPKHYVDYFPAAFVVESRAVAHPRQIRSIPEPPGADSLHRRQTATTTSTTMSSNRITAPRPASSAGRSALWNAIMTAGFGRTWRMS